MHVLTSDRTRRGLLYIGVAAVVFQVVHFLEHMLQAGYWILNPTSPPWLTPWAATGRDMLAVGSNTGTGAELLHLVGNVIFMVGLVALCMLFARAGYRLRQMRSLKLAVWIQGYHVVEHVALTVTYMVAGRAIGLSTLFGTLEGTALSTTRVWFHFLINLAATIYSVNAIRELFQLGVLVPGLGGRHAPANA